ncbi:MAG: Lrp/AsnC ligand binding domain-containing protein [Oceanospirillaceae bacterium]|nr:Lrp/AsnC ligand binding domain-containing protein [Oceanospirillaceae bacterium]
MRSQAQFVTSSKLVVQVDYATGICNVIRGIKNAFIFQLFSKIISRQLIICSARDNGSLDLGQAAIVDEFRQRISNYPEVMECYVLLGAVDVLLRIVTVSVDAYESFFNEHLSQLPGVQEVNSSVVMTKIKQTTELPLHLI